MNLTQQNKSSIQQISLPHQQFDIVTKDVIYMFPEDVLRFILNRTDIKVVEHLETEFVNVEKRELDSLIKVLINEKPVLVHCEFQTDDSTELDMVRRNIGYIGRCYERYGLPILSHVVYLRPNAGQNDPGGVRQNIEGYNFIVEYKVIRLIEVDGQSVLETQQPGMMPFLPLMQPPPDVDTVAWLHQCVEATMVKYENNYTLSSHGRCDFLIAPFAECIKNYIFYHKSLPLDTTTQANLLTEMWIMSGLVHERLPLDEIFPEDIMQESPIYQSIIEKGRAQGIEQGEAQGERKNTIESILELIDIRFQVHPPATLNIAIESIEELSRLKQLRRAAAEVDSLEEFIHFLENGNISD